MCGTAQNRVQPLPWALAFLYLVLHGVIATCLPDKLAPLSTLCIVLAEWIAAGLALQFSGKVKASARTLWWLLAGSRILESVAMCLDMVNEIRGTPVFNFVPALSVFFSMLYDVPLLAAVSIQFDRRILNVARATNALLSFAIVALLYLQIFSLLSLHGTTNPNDAALVSRLFDIVDLYLALAATIRWFGSEQLEERAFFHATSIFVSLNAILPAIHNRILVHQDYVWLDLLLSTPYVALAVLIQAVQRLPVRKPSARIARLVQSGSPIFLSVALLVIGVITARTRFYLGLGAALLSVACYGTLNILAQSRRRANEESLLASKTALEELVGVDSLTGIANRWAFDKALNREYARARRTKVPVSLLMIDVDFFKQLNDTKGHQIGDAYLNRIAAALRAALPRVTDLVARYGGEEFVAILPGTDTAGAADVAGRFCRVIAELRLRHSTSPFGVVTISIGYSTYDGSPQESPTLLTRAADRTLYNAKSLGRNRAEYFAIDSVEV